MPLYLSSPKHSLKTHCFICVLIILFTFISSAFSAQNKPRGRDLGVPFDGSPGALNAITDVKGVEVGHKTVISGDGGLVVGKGPVRTGVTAIFPFGKELAKSSGNGAAAAFYSLNGCGEMTGTIIIEEFGVLMGPLMLTNTLSVGIVRDAVVEWSRNNISDPYILYSRSIPVVAETWDGFLNDIYGFHITKQHVFEALEGATGGSVMEGNVGGGTGMKAYAFKAGIGTSSRIVNLGETSFTVGVLVQANCGARNQLRIAGVPVGLEIADMMPVEVSADKDGSIIIIVATDAPLLPIQLKRLAKRASMGLARTGSAAYSGSGDIMIAFSTTNAPAIGAPGLRSISYVDDFALDPIFEATVQASEEAIINALVAAETMKGINGNVVYAIPHEKLKQALKKYNR